MKWENGVDPLMLQEVAQRQWLAMASPTVP